MSDEKRLAAIEKRLGALEDGEIRDINSTAELANHVLNQSKALRALVRAIGSMDKELEGRLVHEVLRPYLEKPKEGEGGGDTSGNALKRASPGSPE